MKSAIISGLIFSTVNVIYKILFLLTYNYLQLTVIISELLISLSIGFITGLIFGITYSYIKNKFGKYSGRGLIAGFVVTLMLIIIPAFNAPKHNYMLSERQYNDYKYVIKNCGSNPGDDCVQKLCANKGPYDGFCEGVTRKNEGIDPVTGKIHSWKSYVTEKKPNILKKYIPNFKDGLEAYLMIPIFGIIILILPIISGVFIGKLLDIRQK